MNKLLYLIALPAVLLLAACGPKNQLIGKWVSEPMMGVTSTMEFKSGSVVGGSSVGGMSNSNEVKVADYKIEKDKIGVVVQQGDSTATMTYNIIDADTIEQDMGFVKARFHRVK